MKNFVVILLMITSFASCSNPEARKPIVRKTGSFINESIERNKLLNNAENALLMEKMKMDSYFRFYTYLEHPPICLLSDDFFLKKSNSPIYCLLIVFC